MKMRPLKPYSSSNSLASISTNVTTSSSTKSTLLINTTTFETPICFANSKCSRVCVITPSVAAITRIASCYWWGKMLCSHICLQLAHRKIKQLTVESELWYASISDSSCIMSINLYALIGTNKQKQGTQFRYIQANVL